MQCASATPEFPSTGISKFVGATFAERAIALWMAAPKVYEDDVGWDLHLANAPGPRKRDQTPRRGGNLSISLGKTYIAGDLLAEFTRRNSDRALANKTDFFDVILEVNADAPGGARAARGLILRQLVQDHQDLAAGSALYRNAVLVTEDRKRIKRLTPSAGRVQANKSVLTDRYIFARLSRNAIEMLANASIAFPENKQTHVRALHKIWLDHDIEPYVFQSSRTIKADAAAVAFSARGDSIVWAVADSGIDGKHPHFQTHKTLQLPDGLRHLDFTQGDIVFDEDMPSALEDVAGHGTHVAGIIAGECGAGSKITVTRRVQQNEKRYNDVTEPGPERISGVAPLCKLMSLKVLDDALKGKASTLIAAIGYLQRVNNNGQRLRVHGINLSVGYEFDVEWFAAGRSPLCNEVDRLVKSGVVVVAAAGNAGFGRVSTHNASQEQAALVGTISDPGNAEQCITVGSTHRDMPHAYGVSFFSAKGPTADGRAKPDLLAPGERIISASANESADGEAHYKELSGTSMAAPHVSGAIAAFLSIRGEFIGRPDAVKELFLSTATDLKRLPQFQGRGLLDLMRAIQAV